MYAGLLAALRPALPDSLHALPQLFGDDRRVPPGVPDAFELDLAEVVAVLQDALDLGDSKRASGVLRAGECRDSALFEFVADSAHGPLAAGIGGEQPANGLGALRVDLDGA